MALIKCPECGKEISNKAAACVHCGCPISASTTTFGGFQMTSGGNKTFNEFFGENSSIQFSNAKYLKVEFQAVLSGAETESSRQSVFVHDLGRNVEFTVSNTIKVGQSVRVRISTERYDYILFVVASIARPGTRQTAYTRGATNQEAINLLKNYKPNLLVRFFKTGFLKKCIGMAIVFIAAGRFGDIDTEAILLFSGIGMLLLWLGSLYPLANIKSYCKKHHIDEAIRKDTGYMNVAVNAFNTLPTRKMLAYIKELNPAAAQVIERQLAAKKKK